MSIRGNVISTRLTAAQIAAGAGDAVAGGLIEEVSATGQPTGNVFSAGAVGGAPDRIVTIADVQAAVSASLTKVQLTGSGAVAITAATHNNAEVHINTGVTSVTLAVADWTPVAPAIQIVELYNDTASAVPVMISGFTGGLSLDGDLVNDSGGTGAIITIPVNGSVQIYADADGFVRAKNLTVAEVFPYDQARAYPEGTPIIRPDGLLYEASGAIAANTAFALGFGANQWHKVGSTRPPLVTVFQASGTFTPDSRAVATHVEIVGGGGGGGGCAALGANAVGCGTGGNSGAYARVMTASPITAAIAVTVGAAGAGGVGAAGSGGTLSAIVGYVSCAGGAGGPTANGTAAHIILAPNAAIATVTLTSATSIAAVPGAKGGGGWSSRVAVTTPSIVGGFAHGGRTPLGSGGLDEGAVGGIGGQLSIVRAAQGWGSGGAGIAANSSTTSTAKTGGAGMPGLVIITEYF